MSSPMKHLGFFGVLKVTTQILQSNFKHFLCIALALQVLPYAFLVAFTPCNFMQQAISASISEISKIYNATTGGQLPPPPPEVAMEPSSLPLLMSLITIFIFSVFIAFVSLPPITFSVCRGYLKKSLKFKSSLMAIPRSIKNLLLTSVCLYATFTGILIAMMTLNFVSVVILSALKVNLAIPVIILSLGFSVGMVYFIIVWSLVKPVTILEEKWGWNAMSRSNYLLHGSKWLAFFLTVLFAVCALFLPISVSKDASVLWKFSVAAMSVTLQAFISLYGIGTHVVLYLSCKSFHKESVETLMAASAQFGEEPITLSKYMDIESANLNVHT